MANSTPHIVLFPFMSKGHTIPLLHLARLLLDRHVSITVFTTPANRPFIAESLPSSVSIVSLAFPNNIEGVPEGVESTDKLPSMSLFFPFGVATKRMQPDFEEAFRRLPRVTCLISDGFLSWTGDAATTFGIPWLVFYGMNTYSQAVSSDVGVNRLLSGPELDDELFAVTSFPWIKLTRNDFSEPFNARNPSGPHFDFIMDQLLVISKKSYGMIMNSFYELEALYVDYVNRGPMPKAWCIGPLCLSQPVTAQYEAHEKPTWLKWLDHKHEFGHSVLYVAFGSQAEIAPQQLSEIALGLEESEVNFLWVLRNGSDLPLEFEEKVKERGMIVREWVDQRAILEHESVQGFLSHCGWNSVMESICAKVPILAWPMMAEQHLNARMVTEEIKIGFRVETVDGTVRAFVKKDGLKKTVKELMEGEMGKSVWKRVKEHGENARKAMEEGGSSWNSLNQLIDKLQAL